MASADRTTRRRFLASLGAGATVLVGGCIGTSGEPNYVSGEVNASGGKPRTAQEMVAAEALAQQETNDNASPLDLLSLESHEFVVEDSYKGPTVQGTVRNTGENPVTFAEVRVRVYDDSGAQLGRYVATIGDLPAGATWKFTVILLESVSDIADYDIAVLGISR